nr:Transcriptional regulator, IclR family [Kibdelosporangium sp. MJ126-NF4]
MRCVNTTFDILESLAERQPVGVSELARALELPKSTVQRGLTVLADKGWIRPSNRTGHTKWTLTAKALTVAGFLLRDECRLREAAAPIMTELGARTGETVHLTVPVGGNVVLLDRVGGTRPVRTTSWIGGQAPLHASASGLAMLAHLPPHRVESLALTPHVGVTAVDRPALAELVAEVRDRGYAVNLGMWREDVSAVAAAILNPTGNPVAALSISVPTRRFAVEQHAEYGQLVAGAVRQVTAPVSAMWMC